MAILGLKGKFLLKLVTLARTLSEVEVGVLFIADTSSAKAV